MFLSLFIVWQTLFRIIIRGRQGGSYTDIKSSASTWTSPEKGKKKKKEKKNNSYQRDQCSLFLLTSIAIVFSFWAALLCVCAAVHLCARADISLCSKPARWSTGIKCTQHRTQCSVGISPHTSKISEQFPHLILYLHKPCGETGFHYGVCNRISTKQRQTSLWSLKFQTVQVLWCHTPYKETCLIMNWK